jgi:hypothetical protein
MCYGLFAQQLCHIIQQGCGLTHTENSALAGNGKLQQL